MNSYSVNDLTFFTNEDGRRLIDRFKTVFKDTKEKEVLIWKHIQLETVKEYKETAPAGTFGHPAEIYSDTYK